jgi:tetratricopeptide (TPR) repeat protein
LEGADLEGANLKGAVLPEYFEIANEVKPHSCVSCGKLIEQEFRFCPDCGQKAHLLGSSDDAKPYFNRGCTYHELRQYERAIEDYDRAIELYPGYARAFFNRGCAVLEMHFADEKINRHSRFLSPSISKSRFARGIEDYERAIKDYDRAVELDPDYAPTYNYRGWAYHNLKQHRRAIQDYDTAIKLQPKSVTYENRGNAYHTLGDGERGESDLVTARKLRQYENQSSAKTNEMKNNFTWPRSETPEGWVHFSPNWWLSPVRRRQIRLGFRNTHEVEEFIERLEFIDSLGPLDTYGLKFGSQDYQYYVFLFQEYAVAECPQYGNSVFLLEGTGDWQDIFNRSIQDLRRTPYSIDNSIRGRVSWIRHTKTWQQRLKHYLEEKPKGREEGPPERQLTPEQRAPRRAPRTGFRPKPIGFRPKPTGFRPKPINELDETEVVFPDRKLEQAIREKFEKPEGVLNRGDLKRLKELVVEETEIEDITGLEHAVNLTELWLGADLTTQGFRENQITDISSLAGLTNLTSLELGFNQISDITPLEGLTNLTELFLRDNQISDISPLEELTSLARLDLRHNQISSISPLKSHSNLNYFIVDFNPLSRESLDVHIPELQARGVRVYFRQPLLEKEAPSERPPRSGYGGLFEDM